MSSLFSCLGKKSKSKKKKNGKPPETKIVEDLPKEDKNPSIEEDVLGDKVEDLPKEDKNSSVEENTHDEKINDNLNEHDEVEGKDSTPDEVEEDSQQVTLIKELKSKLSIKRDKHPDEGASNESKTEHDTTTEKVTDAEALSDKTDVEEGQIDSDIIEKSVIQSVEAEIGKIEAKARESQSFSKSESISETNLKKSNHILTEHIQQLKKTCEDKDETIKKQRKEIAELQKEYSALKATINYQDKLEHAFTEREKILDTVEQLGDVCSSLQLRLDEIEKEEKAKDMKMKSSLDIKSIMSSVDTDHKELDTSVKNTLRSVQELECRIINLELDKENDNHDTDLATIKDLENSKSKLQQELNTALKNEKEQLNKLNSLESQIESRNTDISELQKENKQLKELLDESSKSCRIKDEQMSSLHNKESNLHDTIRNLESKINQYEARHKSGSDEIANLKTKLEKLDIQLREKEIAHQETIKKLAEAQSKQEDLQQRLSVVSSEKVTVNSIVAQAPSDSPVKIAEKFKELYSSVWREAYDKLRTVCRRDERKVLLILMEYLTECYLYSRRTARHQMDALLSLLTSPTNMRGSLNKRLQKNGQNDNIPNTLKENIMSFRRTPSENFTESIFEEFMNQVDYQKSRHLRNIQARDITEVTPFVRTCIGVCWEMVTQEPPMYLLFKLRHNQIIEKDKFDIYNGDGNKVDFLVWPALLRDENGPMLQKGVVQAVHS